MIRAGLTQGIKRFVLAWNYDAIFVSSYMCVCVCVCVFVYVYIHIHTYVHTYIKKRKDD